MAARLYAGPANTWGTASDPLIGKPVGGVIVFGGPCGKSASGWGHPECGHQGAPRIAEKIHAGIVRLRHHAAREAEHTGD